MLIRRRVGRRPTCRCSACRGDHGSVIVPKAKGGALSAGGEMPAVAAVRDEAGAVSRRLKEMKEALSQVH